MKKSKIIYMDYASSSIVSGANPSAIHALGMKVKKDLEEARVKVASVLSAQKSEILFTSGATESNNLAILGLVENFEISNLKNKKNIPHIITTNIEHSSVLEVCKYLEKKGRAEVSFVEVESDGIIDPKKIKKEIKENTILISVGYANNEIGTIMPLKEISKLVRFIRKQNSSLYPYLHTDAVQAVNYLNINILQLGVDLLSFNSSKIGGPKGVGVLFVKRGVKIAPIMYGGDQELGLRPGTENTLNIVAFAKVLEKVEKEKNKEKERLTKIRNYFFKQVKKIDQIIINGSESERLPNNINITIPNIPSDLLVIELSERGIMTSAKSACRAGDGKASYVISAIDKNLKETDGSLRFSLGVETKKEDIDFVLRSLKDILKKLQRWYN
jgi:cysteine desulfurase